MGEQRVLTIDRSKWRRGNRKLPSQASQSTSLLNANGFMCCLGFEAVACGLTADEITNQADPEELFWAVPVEHRYSGRYSDYFDQRVETEEDAFGYLLAFNSHLIDEAMATNDDPNISEEEREKRVSRILIELGWDEVVFVGPQEPEP